MPRVPAPAGAGTDTIIFFTVRLLSASRLAERYSTRVRAVQCDIINCRQVRVVCIHRLRGKYIPTVIHSIRVRWIAAAIHEFRILRISCAGIWKTCGAGRRLEIRQPEGAAAQFAPHEAKGAPRRNRSGGSRRAAGAAHPAALVTARRGRSFIGKPGAATSPAARR